VSTAKSKGGSAATLAFAFAPRVRVRSSLDAASTVALSIVLAFSFALALDNQSRCQLPCSPAIIGLNFGLAVLTTLLVVRVPTSNPNIGKEQRKTRSSQRRSNSTRSVMPVVKRLHQISTTRKGRSANSARRWAKAC